MNASVSTLRFYRNVTKYTIEVSMYTNRQCAKSAAVILLLLAVTIIMGSVISVYAFPGLGPDIPANDFMLTASKTLIKIQPGQSGSLVIWANLYCPNATSSFVSHAWSNYNFACDTSILQIVNLQIISGCPTGALCVLDRTQIMILPTGPIASEAATNFFIYSLSSPCTSCSCGSCAGSSVSLVTVIGTDQFGHTHAVQFGVAIGYYD